MRKKLMKRREVFNNIIGCIISFFILIGFFVIMYFLVKTIGNMFGLMFKTFESGIGIDKFITPIAVLFYILCVILLTVYVLDLFIILLSNFLGPVIKLKNEDKHRKIFSFTITGFIEEKCNHQKVQIKLLVSFLVLMIICICVSYTTNGYLKHSLNDTPSHKDLYTIEESAKYINIDGYNGNIYFKKSETNDFIVEYQYEFKHDFDVIIENNNLSINLEMTKAYDILNFLNEPIQVVYIATLVLFSIPAIFTTLSSRSNRVIEYRKKSAVMFSLLIISIIPFFLSKTEYNMSFIFAPSLAFFLSNFFLHYHNQRKINTFFIIFS